MSSTYRTLTIFSLILFLFVGSLLFFYRSRLAIDFFGSKATSPFSVSIGATWDGTDEVTVDFDITIDSELDVPLASLSYYFWFDCSSESADPGEAQNACGSLPTPPIGECQENMLGKVCNSIPYTSNFSFTHVYTARDAPYTAKIIVEATTLRGQSFFAENRTSLSIPSSLECHFDNSSAFVGETTHVTASGGDGNYLWEGDDGSTVVGAEGNGADIVFSTAGHHTVIVKC